MYSKKKFIKLLCKNKQKRVVFFLGLWILRFIFVFLSGQLPIKPVHCKRYIGERLSKADFLHNKE